MRVVSCCLLQLLLLLATASPEEVGEEEEHSLHRVAFGSCNEADRPGLWRVIETVSRPDGLILLGDNMYADERKGLVFVGSNATNLRRQYRNLQNNPDLQSLLASLAGPFALDATFDDHDYGINNGDKTYPLRNLSQSYFWDFLREPSDSLRRLQSGVYTSRTVWLRPDWAYKIILLDSRSNKDPLGTTKGDFLGQEQWAWLARELKDTVPNLIILGSSIQVLPQDKLLEETWHEFPLARQRLLDLIGLDTAAPNLVLLSGDVHTAEVLQAKCRYVHEDGQNKAAATDQLEDFRLFEFTSSGLSHTFSKTTRKKGSANTRVLEHSKGLLFEVAYDMYVATGVAHSREHHYGDHYKGLHYGLLDFLLPPNGQPPSSLTVSINDYLGKTVMYRTLPLKPKVPASIWQPPLAVKCMPFWGEVSPWRVRLARASLLMIPVLFVAAPVAMTSFFLWRLVYFVAKGKLKGKLKET